VACSFVPEREERGRGHRKVTVGVKPVGLVIARWAMGRKAIGHPEGATATEGSPEREDGVIRVSLSA
jgi:hypothetical protein